MEMSLYDCKGGNLLVCFECGEDSNQCKCTTVKPICSSENVKSVKSAPIFANLSSEKIILPSCNIVNV